jgi:hypothetical protein
MNKSKFIGNQATSAKRVATSIVKLVSALELEHTAEVIISKDDKALLLKAAVIMSKIGSKKATVAKAKKAEEFKRQKLIEDKKLEVKSILNTWTLPVSVLDKISLILTGNYASDLKTYLDDGLPTWKRESESKDWLNMLNDLVEDTKREIPDDVAFRISVNNEKTVFELMNDIAYKTESLKSSVIAKTLEKSWSVKIDG